MEERLRRVYHEVYPNGGDSLRDAVNQANERLAIICPDPCGQPAPPENEGELPSRPPTVPPQPDPPDEPSGP
ncbi:hypothetical protein [Streptomyces chartreusis]|uniref:hypothetical protein n=1 Tax=Streptomyces chartreusis TaxID=1969 RepID=UPI002E80CE84|nr:hypothetical protein [Streptomyces chartreusis]WUB15336.1 hypothetical protein OG997_00920 [Streptomyces chartreusis]